MVSVVAVLSGTALSWAAPPAVAGARTPTSTPRPQIPAPDKRVYFVTESVGLGAKNALPAAFPPDWQVTVDGTPALFVEQLESKHVRTRMAAAPWVFGDVAVVGGGHNYPFWDPPRFDRSVDSMIAALHEAGVKRIYWVTLREVKPEFISAAAWRQVQPYYWYFPEVNRHLRQALTRHPELTLIDWAAIADRPGLTYDAIHLNSVGAALYSKLIADTVMETANRPLAGTVTKMSVTKASVAGLAGVGVTPAAVAVNLTVVDPRAAGFLTAYPCSTTQPFVANASFEQGQIVAAAAIVPVAPDGSICVANSEATHLVVDVTGSFPVRAGFVPLSPARLVDTRELGARQAAGTALEVPVLGTHGIPADAKAVAVTVTAVEPVAGGFVTVDPCGQAPSDTSSLNFDAGATVPNLVIVAPGKSGSICLRSNVATHLIVDVSGAFDQSADMGLVGPVRLVDTRVAPGRRLDDHGTLRLHVRGVDGVADNATGVMLNLTGVNPASNGYLTAYPCSAGAPLTSSLNLTAGVNRGNFVIVAPDADGDVCVSTYGPTDVVIDLFGWMGTTFAGTTPARLVDTRGLT
jgi:hypothetical protein